ncbi:HlyD family secretion protein [Aneurinibacillus terranovensis]|uniref:HlyD family secretion protein n=1 Tax=Aneurinibacillus terranovensis TaxID=278991 RepID=UPI0003FCA9D2|nr:HlyD family efflux transporter periplasmic adaptor subunit [Aneurinibacillus terranovensis]
MKSIRAIMFALMVLLIGSGAYALSSYREVGQAAETTASEPTAYIESTTINASFKIGGRIQQFFVKEGDHVKKGQILARLESQELLDKAAQAQAAVNAAQSQVSQAQAAVGAAEAKKMQGSDAVTVTAQTADRQIAQAQAAVKAAQANLDALKNGARKEEREQANINLNATKEAFQIAATNLDRMKSLLNAGAVAQAAVDDASLKYQEAKAKYEAAQQQVNMLKNGTRPEQIQAAQAQLEQAQAAVALAQAGKGQVRLHQDDVHAADAGVKQAQASVDAANAGVSNANAALQEAQTYIGYTELRAPADGIITTQSAQLGELVSSGFPVLTLETNQDRWAKFYFPETEIGTLKNGDIVTMKLLSTGKPVKGKVTVIEPATDFAIQKPTQSTGDKDIRSFGVKVTLTDLPKDVPTGMTLMWQGKGAR